MMASKADPSSSQLDDSSPLLAAEGNISAVDDKTLHHTPAPLAASTVVRKPVDRDRYRDVQENLGSFIEENGSSSKDESGLGLVKMSWSDEDKESSSLGLLKGFDMKSGSSSDANRSSLGLLEVENMEDLSSSMLHFNPPPQTQPNPTSTAQQRAAQEMDVTPTATSHISESKLGPKTLFHQSRDHGPQSHQAPDQGPQSRQPSDQRHGFPQASAQRTQSRQTSNQGLDECSNLAPRAHKPGIIPPRSHKSSEGFDECGPGLDMFPAHLLFSAANDADTSIHKVELADDELQQFDETFSDLENTMTDEGDSAFPVGGSGNLFDTPHPLHKAESKFGEPESDGFDEIDPKLSVQGDESFMGNSNVPIQNSKSNKSTFETDLTTGGALDAIYFRRSPQHVSHLAEKAAEDSDLEDTRVNLKQTSAIFDDDDTQLEEDKVVSGEEEDSYGSTVSGSSEDEVEAVRREMYATYMRLNQQSEAARAAVSQDTDISDRHVEGQENDNTRFQATPLSNRETPPQMNTVMVKPLDKKVESRNIPIGCASSSEDVSFVTRKVHFVSPMGWQNNTTNSQIGESFMSAASDLPAYEHPTESTITPDQSQHPEDTMDTPDQKYTEVSRLAEHYFTPSKGLAEQSTTFMDQSNTRGLEESTFNMFDAFQDKQPAVTSPEQAVTSPGEGAGTDSPGSPVRESPGREGAECDDTLEGVSFQSMPSFQASFSKPADGSGGGDLNTGNSFSFGAAQQADFSGFGDTGQSAGFVSADEGAKILAADEKEFEEENKFRKDEVMSLNSTQQSSLGLPDSWSLHSQMTLPPSWTLDSNIEHHDGKVSIGGFIGARTEVLGALDGETLNRPDFGNLDPKSPPSRKPRALVDKTPTQELENSNDENNRKKSDDRVAASPKNEPPGGVAASSEHEPPPEVVVVSPATADRLAQEAMTEVNKEHPQNDVITLTVPANPEDNTPTNSAGHSPQSKDATPSSGNSTVTLDISELTKMINLASVDTKPGDLAEMIMKMSHNKKSRRQLDVQPELQLKSSEPQVKTHEQKHHQMSSTSSFSTHEGRLFTTSHSSLASTEVPFHKSSVGTVMSHSSREELHSDSAPSLDLDPTPGERFPADGASKKLRQAATLDIIRDEGENSTLNYSDAKEFSSLLKDNSTTKQRLSDEQYNERTQNENRRSITSTHDRDDTCSELSEHGISESDKPPGFVLQQKLVSPPQHDYHDSSQSSDVEFPQHNNLYAPSIQFEYIPTRKESDPRKPLSHKDFDEGWASPRPSSIMSRSHRKDIENYGDLSRTFTGDGTPFKQHVNNGNYDSNNSFDNSLSMSSSSSKHQHQRPASDVSRGFDVENSNVDTSTENNQEWRAKAKNRLLKGLNRESIPHQSTPKRPSSSARYVEVPQRDYNDNTNNKQSSTTSQNITDNSHFHSYQQNSSKYRSQDIQGNDSQGSRDDSRSVDGSHGPPTSDSRSVDGGSAHTLLSSRSVSGDNIYSYSSASQAWGTPHQFTAPRAPNSSPSSEYDPYDSTHLGNIEAPPEMRIPEVCCIGLSTTSILPLRNPTTRWLSVYLSVVGLHVNGDKHNPESNVPFVMKDKVIVGPGTTESLKVIFAPKHAGVYVGQLQLTASAVVADKPLVPNKIPTMVTLQAVAEKPTVRILNSGGDYGLVDYGSLPWGCQKGMKVTLINTSRAHVPIRAVIAANNNMWNCFTFDKYGSEDTSVISSTTRTSVNSLAPSVVNHILPGVREDGEETPVTMAVYFRAPTRQLDRTVVTGPPERFQARLDIEVDTPSNLLSLGTVTLQAAVGTARLHTPRDMENVYFKIEPGRLQTQAIPLRNAGNIPLEVSLEVTNWTELFTVIPMQLMIEPGGQSEVLVKFEPKKDTTHKDRYETLLLMYIEPDGPGYEVQLFGDVAQSQGLGIPQAFRSNQPMVLSNKHFVAWGGVPLGRAKQQSITLKNAMNQMLKLRLEIRGNTQDFKLQSLFGNKERLAPSKEIVLKPLEEYPLHLLFSPTVVNVREAKLQVKPSHTNTKYTIPLAGYGGISKLLLEGCQKGQNSSYWTSLGFVQRGSELVTKVKIVNRGSRAAFVKAIGYQDLGCKKQLPDTRITVAPNEFCIKEKQNQTIVIALTVSDIEAALCDQRASIVAAVSFVYGDEVMRQQFRKQLNGKRPDTEVDDRHPAAGVNFNQPYQDEDLVCEGSLVPTPNDADLFYSSMSKLTLALVGEPLKTPSPKPEPVILSPPLKITAKQFQPPAPTMTVPPAVWEADKPSRRSSNKAITIEKLSQPVSYDQFQRAHTPPVHGSPSSSKPDHNGSTEEWSVKPDQIILVAPKKDDPGSMLKRLQITNFSNRAINYDLSWPGHYVSVTPEGGTVAARSYTVICISAVYRRSVSLPWKGSMQITCDGVTKYIELQIREDMILDDSVLLTNDTPEPLYTQPGTPLLAVKTPKRNPCPSNIKVAKEQLVFEETPVGRCSKCPLEFTNTSPFPVKWAVSSFAPPYLRSEDEGRGVFRVLYSAFWLPKMTGLLLPDQSEEVLVEFSPREAGVYSQYWDIKTETQAATIHAKHESKVEFVGQSIQEPIGAPAPKTLTRSQLLSTGNLTATMLKSTMQTGTSEIENIISLKPRNVKFELTLENDVTVCKVEMRNKDKKAHTVEIVSPKSPFEVKHVKVTLKARHYSRLPVLFHPRKAGYYTGVLVIKVDNGATLTVSLQGECQKIT